MQTTNSTAYPDNPPGYVAPAPLVVPTAQLPTRIGLRTVAVSAANPGMLTIKDQPLASGD